MQTVLNRSLLALATGVALVSFIGTTKLISVPQYQAMHEWEGTALLLVIPLAYLAFRKFRIS